MLKPKLGAAYTHQKHERLMQNGANEPQKNTEGKQRSLLTQGSLIWFFVAALYFKGNDITPIILLQSIPKL